MGPDMDAVGKALAAMETARLAQEKALQVEKYLKLNGDGTVTQTLQYPFVQTIDRGQGARDETVAQLKYARPRGRHMRKLASVPDTQDGAGVELLEEILIELAGVRPEVFADKLDAVDYSRALAAFGLFFPQASGPSSRT